MSLRLTTRIYRSLNTLTKTPKAPTTFSLTRPTTSPHLRTMSNSTLPPFQRPESLKDSSNPPKIHLYTLGTPNGVKVSILLEELLLAYPENPSLSYDFSALSFKDADQKKPEYLKICPNGRIPAIVDENVKVDDGAGGQKGHNVWESASCLLWLVENYDTEFKFWFKDPVLRSSALSWIFFAHGGVGPMQGQANHFVRYAPEKIPYGIKRYQEETQRLYTVLEDGLNAGKGEWLVGDKFSVVDINVFGWVNAHAWAGIDLSPTPKLAAWIERIKARKGVYNGLGVPERKKPMSKEEEEKAAQEAREWIFKK